MAKQTPSSAIRPHMEKIRDTHDVPRRDATRDPIDYSLKPATPGNPKSPPLGRADIREVK